MEGKCQGNYEAMRVKSNVKSSQSGDIQAREEVGREIEGDRRKEGPGSYSCGQIPS